MIFIESKEFGQEVYFGTDRGTVDSRIPNRYWFELPQNWSVQRKNDPVIGISEIYFNQRIRVFRYKFTLELLDPTMGGNEPIPEYTLTFTDFQYLSRNQTFRDFVNGFVNSWYSTMTSKNLELASYKVGETARPLTPYKGFNMFMDIGYETRGSETVSVLKIDCMSDPDRWNNVIVPSTGGTLTVIPRITIKMLNDDAIEGMNGSKNEIEMNAIDGIDDVGLNFIVDTVVRERVLRLYPLWDRNNVYIISDISSMTDGGFLGYSRSEPLHRMKFYRLDNKIQKFWIEIYSARDNRVRSVLPKDGMDYLAIEGVVYFDASKALK